MSTRGRAIGALTGVLVLVAAPGAARAAAAPSTGLWSGTITLTSSGAWDYTVGYRGEDERRSQGTSAHELNWTVTLDQLRGSSEFADFVDEEDGSVQLTQFKWSGTAKNAGQSDCNYAANGSMTGSAVGGLYFHGVSETGRPAIAGEGSVPIPLSLTRSSCSPGIIFGFSGPNAATLWSGGGYDVLLLNNATTFGPSHEPLMSLCSEPETLDRVPAPQTDTSGRTVVRATAAGSCSGRRVEWFGDSDVHHDSSVALSYRYDLTFQPDHGVCSDGIDNDGDGTVDDDGGDNGEARDPGCDSAGDPNESGLAECDNAGDDDGDLRTDFRRDGTGDPGCESLTDTTELSDDCASAQSADLHSTTLDVPARLNLALYPDPALGTLHMRIPWCMTPQGPRIREDSTSFPSGWWDGTTNWLLLGGLQWFGVTVDTPPGPWVEHGHVSARVNTSLQANVDASEAILSAVPVGKLFKPLKTAIGKHAKKLNPLVKRLDVLHAKTNKATRNMTASAKKARKARDTLAEVRGRIADTQRALDAATTASKRRELQQQLTGLKKTERSAKRVATILSADHQADIRELRRIKAEEEKLARKVDQILKKIRRLDAEVLKLKKQVREAIDKRVAVVRPDWAREAVEGFVDDIDAKINGPLKIVSSKLRKLSSDELLKILKKGTATSSVVQLLKSTYTESVRQITHVKVPVWEADITVSFDQEGRPTVADNSHGRWVFTVLTAPTIHTS